MLKMILKCRADKISEILNNNKKITINKCLWVKLIIKKESFNIAYIILCSK